jgi:DNA-binding SARP family transcriptional activator
MEVGLASIAGEPLRESAHRAVIRIHLAEGNKAEAFRQYRLYRTLLHDQLGLSPSAQMEELVRGLDATETIG